MRGFEHGEESSYKTRDERELTYQALAQPTPEQTVRPKPNMPGADALLCKVELLGLVLKNGIPRAERERGSNVRSEP